MTTGSHGEIQLENDWFRVTRWTIAPSGMTPALLTRMSMLPDSPTASAMKRSHDDRWVTSR